MKDFFNNRQRTNKTVNEIMSFLGHHDWFKALPEQERFTLAMEFFQCEKGRMQKGKMVIDVLIRLTPLILSIATLVLALKR